MQISASHINPRNGRNANVRTSGRQHALDRVHWKSYAKTTPVVTQLIIDQVPLEEGKN